MQRTSSCGELDNLRKITPSFNAMSGASHEFKNTASRLSHSLRFDTGIGAFRKLVILNGKLQLERLDEMAEKLILREQFLGLPKELVLFDWPLVKPPAGALASGSIMNLHIPKPLGHAKLVLADLYAKKYGILIVCKFDGHDTTSVVDALIEKVRTAQGKPVGLIVPARPPGAWFDASNYRGHVVPLIVQQTDAGFDVVNLDSLADNSQQYQQFLEVLQQRMTLLGATLLRHGLVKNRRQADRQSCHTDALQILKDTLCVVQEKGNVNCLDMLVKNKGVVSTSGNSARFSLPSFLQKTNQRSQALQDDNFEGVCMLQPERAASPFGEKSMTIGQHRYKYTAELASKKSNYFLTVKAFYNVRKVIDHLESMPSASARQHYLTQLAIRS